MEGKDCQHQSLSKKEVDIDIKGGDMEEKDATRRISEKAKDYLSQGFN